MSDVMQRIDELVKANEVVLFMKGSASFPMCGFSGRAIQVLKACGVDTKTVKTVNVLDDAEIRHGIKEYSNWPTIPQLYVKGEFVGGSDIMMEMYESGELQTVLNPLNRLIWCRASTGQSRMTCGSETQTQIQATAPPHPLGLSQSQHLQGAWQ